MIPRSLLAPMLLVACVPSFEDRPWLVDRPRILAVVSSPAEVLPSQPVNLQALTVTPDGPSLHPIEFAFCLRPRAAAERTSVADTCLQGDDLQPLVGPTPMLADACARFGPNPPPTEGDHPAQRPADPDATGGYHVPVEATVPGLDARAFGRIRVRCDLAGATRMIFDEFEARYRPNEAPAIASAGPCEDAPSIGPTVAAPGESVELCVRTEPTAAEPFVVYSETEARLIDDRESLTLRWYTTDGALARGQQTHDFDASDPATTFAVDWRAPDAPGLVHVWAVLSDSRGGATWAELTIDVQR